MISVENLIKITKLANKEFLSQEIESFVEKRLIDNGTKGLNSCVFYASDFSFVYPDEYAEITVPIYEYSNGKKIFKNYNVIKRLKNEYSILKNRVNILKLVGSHLSLMGYEISYEDPFLKGCEESFDFKGDSYKINVIWK